MTSAPLRWPTGRGGRFDPLLTALACAVVYGLLRQDSFYGVDGWSDLRRVGGGDARSDMHLLYNPGLTVAWAALSRLGATLYESATWFSALGSALGVALLHAATLRLGVARGPAWCVAALTASAPAVVFFATVVERHGPFLAYAGLCGWAAACFSMRPDARRALLLALCTTLAYAAHSTGVLLLGLLLPLALVHARRAAGSPWPDRRLWWLAALVVGVTSVGLVLARQIALWVGQSATGTANLAFLLQHGIVHLSEPLAAPVTLWQEWIWPFLPLSLAWLPAMWIRRDRALGIAFLLGLLGYLQCAFLIVGSFCERGAYLLPLAWPAAWLTVRVFGPSRAWLLAGLALVLAVLAVGRHDARPLDAMARGWRAAVGDRPVYQLIAAPADFEFVQLHRPELFGYPPLEPIAREFWDLVDACEIDAALLPGLLPVLDSILAGKHHSGRWLVVSEASLRFLDELPDWIERRDTGPLLARHLRDRYRLEPIASEGFTGYRLVPR